MYNENEQELKNTLRGVLHNYNCLKNDPYCKFSKDDMLVMCIADGYDRIPESFKKYAREKKFLDESILIEKGFMELTQEGEYKMKDLKDCMDDVVRDKAPSNLLHCF